MSKDGKRLRLTPEEVEIINESRGKSLSNINGNTALDLHLKDRGINKNDVVSVKHWQNMGGDLRFSIVTKEQYGVEKSDLLKDIENLIKTHTPIYAKIKRVKGEHLLVINPADIHIGKLAVALETGDEYNTEIAYKRVLVLIGSCFVSGMMFYILIMFIIRPPLVRIRIAMVNGGSILK